MTKMKPLTSEEKEEHDLDVDKDYSWDKSGNIQKKGGGLVRRLDMDSKMSKEIKRKGVERGRKEARNKVKDLIEENTEFTYEDAPMSLLLVAERAITGSSADMKLFLAEARGVGKLAEKSQDAAPQKIILEISKEVREAMIRGIEIIERGQQRRITGEDAPDSPF